MIGTDGVGHLCDSLVGDSPPACSTPSLEVDWSMQAWPPPPMHTVAGVQVSFAPVEISGSLKYEIIYPGVL